VSVVRIDLQLMVPNFVVAAIFTALGEIQLCCSSNDSSIRSRRLQYFCVNDE
jgi:hypothetical protein